MFRTIGRPIARTAYVRTAIADQADLRAFRRRPSARLILGVVLITLSSFMGWPAVALSGCIAVHQRDAWIFILGGPTVYALSWIVWGLGLLIAGRDAMRYANLFTRWFARKGTEWMLGGREAALKYLGSLPAEIPSESVDATCNTNVDDSRQSKDKP